MEREDRIKEIWRILQQLDKQDRKTLILFMGDYKKNNNDLKLSQIMLKNS